MLRGQRVKIDRSVDRYGIDHGLNRQLVTELVILRDEQPIDRRIVDQEQQRCEGQDKEDNKQSPSLHSYQEEKDARKNCKVDLKIAGEAEQAHNERMSEQNQESQGNCTNVLTEAMQLRNEHRHEDHEDVVDIDDDQPIKIVQRMHHDMGGRAPDRGDDHNIHEALTTDHVRISRDNADGQKRVDPARQMHGLPRWLPEKV